MKRIRATVCEFRNEPEQLAEDWERLVAHVKAEQSELVVLPEMGFSPWFCAGRVFDPTVWQAALEVHDQWMLRLQELSPAMVMGSRPVEIDAKRLNEGFVWTPDAGHRAVHHKYYLPDDAGYWEASWYQRGDGSFQAFDAGPLRCGMLICTELWFMERARAYGKDGIHLLVTPRATPSDSVDEWLAGGRSNAIVSGAFSLSSTLHKLGEDPAADLGGQGWIVDPDGRVLGATSQERPFLTLELDLTVAERAKGTYPRYVLE